MPTSDHGPRSDNQQSAPVSSERSVQESARTNGMFMVPYDNRGQVHAPQELDGAQFERFRDVLRGRGLRPTRYDSDRRGLPAQTGRVRGEFSDAHPLSEDQMAALFGRLPRTGQFATANRLPHQRRKAPQPNRMPDQVACSEPPPPDLSTDAYLRDFSVDPLRAPLAGGLGSSALIGPTQSTDNAVARYDGSSGTVIQNSGVTIDDGGAITAPSLSLGNPLPHTSGGTGNAGDPPDGALLIGNTAQPGGGFSIANLTAGPGILIANGSGIIQIDTVNNGDVVGPPTSNDNAITRFDGTTGKLVQDSGVLVTDANAVVAPTAPGPIFAISDDPGDLPSVRGVGIGGQGMALFDVNGDSQLEILDDGTGVKMAKGLIGVEQASSPHATAAAEGTIYIRNTTPTLPYFEGDTGTDVEILTAGRNLAGLASVDTAIGNIINGGSPLAPSAGSGFGVGAAVALVTGAGAPGSAPMSNFFKTITDFSAETTPAADDELLLYDSSANDVNKITTEDLLKATNVLTAGTPLLSSKLAGYLASASAARSFTPQAIWDLLASLASDTPVLTDTFAFSDGGTTTDKATLQTLFNLINSLTSESAPATGDKLALYDASASSTDGITLADMLKVLNGLTEDTAPDAANDFALTYDASAGEAKKVKLTNLVSGVPLTKVKTSDQTDAFDTSLNNDTDLQFTVPSTGTYLLEAQIRVSNNNYKIDFDGGTAGVSAVDGQYFGHDLAGGESMADITSSTTDYNITFGSSGRVLFFFAYVTFSSTGTFIYRHAQNSSGAGTITYAGSWMRLTKV